MKKIRFFLSAVAMTAAFAGATVGAVTDTEIFRLEPDTGQLKVPHEIIAPGSYFCDQGQSNLFCTQEYEVDGSNQPIQPADDPEMGEYVAL